MTEVMYSLQRSEEKLLAVIQKCNESPLSMVSTLIIVTLSVCLKSAVYSMHTHTYRAPNVCSTSPPLFFDTRACMFLRCSKLTVTLVGFVWLLFQDSVTPVYKAAMWFPQFPGFHSKRPGSQCSTVSAIHLLLLTDSPLLKRTSPSPCSHSSLLQHNLRSDGAAFLPW